MKKLPYLLWLKKYHPKKFRIHQQKAGRIGGKRTNELHDVSTKFNNLPKYKLREFASRGGRQTQKLHPGLSSRTLKRTHKEHPADYWSKIMKRTQRKYPNLAKKAGLKTQRLHPEIAEGLVKWHGAHPKMRSIIQKRNIQQNPELRKKSSMRFKKTHERWKNRDIEGYKQHQREAGISGGHKGGKMTHKLHPNQGREFGKKWGPIGGRIGGKIGGPRAMENQRKGKPYIWKKVHFNSRPEIKLAPIILKKPIDGINCNVVIGSKVIDFFPQKYDKMFQGEFVEYHEFNSDKLGHDLVGRTREEYKKERELAIANSKYKGTPLIILDRQDAKKLGCKL
jgi:hypothetical protein